MEVVVVDLLHFKGPGLREWRRLKDGDQEALVREAAREMVQQVSLYADGAKLENVADLSVNIASLESQRLGVDQLPVKVMARYAHEENPAKLTLWSHIFDAIQGDPIPFQIILYREGSMVMLPSEWSGGFPLNFECEWDEPVVPLAKRADLESSMSTWRNRPPYALLERVGATVYWTVRLAYPLLGREGALEEDLKNPRGLVSSVGTGLRLGVAGGMADDVSLEVNLLPLSAHAIAHGRDFETPLESSLLVEFRMEWIASEPPEAVTVAADFSLGEKAILMDLIVDGDWQAGHLLNAANGFELKVMMPSSGEATDE